MKNHYRLKHINRGQYWMDINQTLRAEIQTLAKIKDWLEEEVERTELNDESLCESNDDFIVFGRRECAESLLKQIK